MIRHQTRMGLMINGGPMFNLFRRNSATQDKMVPVVIPHYRAPEALKRTVAAAKVQAGIDTDIFVRDNSIDNILFTRAVNEGLEKYCFSGKHDFVLVLNQDAVLEPNCLRHLVDLMLEKPTVGIAAPVQVTPEYRPTWFGSLQAFPFGMHEMRSFETSTAPFPTYWANGACMLLRCEMVREIGLLDKNLRFICSDSDYSFTARSRGWEVMVVPSARVEHALTSSGGTETPTWLQQIKVEDVIHFSQKWITGDLYRRMSWEGTQLSHEYLAEQMGMLQTHLKLCQDQLGQEHG